MDMTCVSLLGRKRIFIYGRCIFFFQAEDGIRDGHVTGVQTWLFRSNEFAEAVADAAAGQRLLHLLGDLDKFVAPPGLHGEAVHRVASGRGGRPGRSKVVSGAGARSEERRVRERVEILVVGGWLNEEG